MSKSSNKAKLELIDAWIKARKDKDKTTRRKKSRLDNYKKNQIR